MFVLAPPLFHLISDAPIVSVHLASEEPVPNRVIIRAERENVTLKCRANANPAADSFGWFKNVSVDGDRQTMATRHRLIYPFISSLVFDLFIYFLSPSVYFYFSHAIRRVCECLAKIQKPCI